MNNIRYIVPDAFFDRDHFIRNVFVRIHKSQEIFSVDLVDKMTQEELKYAEYQRGIICSGLTNAHTHTELSNLKNSFEYGRGMTHFIDQIRQNKPKTDHCHEINEQKTWLGFYDQGIDNVVDIRNGECKTDILHSFGGNVLTLIELFSPREEDAYQIAESGVRKAKTLIENELPAYIAMHSPYSLSASLRNRFVKKIKAEIFPSGLHFMESREERQMFDNQVDQKYFTYPGIAPVEFLKACFPPQAPLLLVHNVFLREGELKEIVNHFPNVFFVFCPLSNEFIHQETVDAEMFVKYAERILIGTDSWASNRKMDLISEAFSLSAKFPSIEPEFWFRVLSQNGMRFFDLVYAFTPQIKLHKKGLAIIRNVNPDYSLRHDSYSERLL